MFGLRPHRPLVRHFRTWNVVNGYSTGNGLQRSAFKGYLDKLQADLHPHLSPLVQKARLTADALKRLTRDAGDSKDALQRAGRALNELTGYTQIDAVKQKVNHKAKAFETTRDQVQDAKQQYEHAIEQRSTTQRGINELLQRKHLWTGEDVTRFTELYRLEHEHSQAESQAKEHYQQCEKKMDREYMDLAHSIMERYHEEQLWSDKIRSVSTYGTWALMVLNLLLFVAVQTVFEPRKRKRLTDRFEELLVATVQEEEAKVGQVFTALDEKNSRLEEQQRVVLATLSTLLDSNNSNNSSNSSIPNESNAFPIKEAVVDQPLQLPMSSKSQILHTAQSALAGSLITALAVYFWS